jgi:hypothetical protein
MRPGEDGLSVFDAEKVSIADILPWFRPDSLVATVEQSYIESLGLRIEPSAGNADLPSLLRDNHLEIRPGAGMTRKQFKLSLRALDDALGGTP